MKRKKPKAEVNLDISNNFQETPEGFKRTSISALRKHTGDVDSIMLNGVLEQLSGLARINALRDIQKALKPGGRAFATVAHWSNPEAFMSPFSQWPPMTPEFFGFFSEEVRKRSGNYKHPLLDDINFDVGWVEMYSPEWQNRSDQVRQFAARHYTNVLKGFTVTLTKKEKK